MPPEVCMLGEHRDAAEGDVPDFVLDVPAVLRGAGEHRVRIRTDDVGEIPHVVEMRVTEEDELGPQRGKLRDRRAAVADSGPWRAGEAACTDHIGIEEYDVALERGDEAAHSNPGENHAVAPHGPGLRIDVVDAQVLLASGDGLRR